MRNKILAFASCLLVAIALSTTAPGAAAETWRVSTEQLAESVEGKAFQRFAELTEKYSNGQLTLKLFPNAQLGKIDAVLEQLSSGLIQMHLESMTELAKWSPDISYMSAPFLFADADHWHRFMRSDLVKQWMQQAAEKGGVAVLGDPTIFLRGPYRVIVSTRPIKVVDDIKGLKLRLVPDELASSAWTYLGADVRLLNFGEVYSALDRGLVEAVTAPITLVEPMRFTEVAKTITRTNEYPQSVAFMVNAKALSGLKPELGAALERAHVEAAAYDTELVNGIVKDSLANVQAKGATYQEIDTMPFVNKMHDFYAERDKAGKLPKGFLAAVEATR